MYKRQTQSIAIICDLVKEDKKKYLKQEKDDIKNLFLTMGNFVERSQDEEMKAFYKEKIFPFAIDEIDKNYLYSQLYQIPRCV